MSDKDRQSLPDKKVDAYEDELKLRRLKLVAETDRGEYTGDGTVAAVSVNVNGRDFTVTDNPGGTPLPDYVVDAVKARAEALGYKVEDMGAADTDPDHDELPGAVKGRRQKD